MKIKSLDRYDNPWELLDCHVPDALRTLTDEEQDELKCACDYESIALYVVNDNTVLTVDTVTDDVLAEDDLYSFSQQSVAWARERSEIPKF